MDPDTHIILVRCSRIGADHAWNYWLRNFLPHGCKGQRDNPNKCDNRLLKHCHSHNTHSCKKLRLQMQSQW